jgi:hypothetical protein
MTSFRLKTCHLPFPPTPSTPPVSPPPSITGFSSSQSIVFVPFSDIMPGLNAPSVLLPWERPPGLPSSGPIGFSLGYLDAPRALPPIDRPSPGGASLVPFLLPGVSSPALWSQPRHALTSIVVLSGFPALVALVVTSIATGLNLHSILSAATVSTVTTAGNPTPLLTIPLIALLSSYI